MEFIQPFSFGSALWTAVIPLDPAGLLALLCLATFAASAIGLALGIERTPHQPRRLRLVTEAGGSAPAESGAFRARA
jgi:hypothetical protein